MHQEQYPRPLADALDRAELPSLDGLRTVAVFLIVFYHLGFRINGGLGVLVFFVISGFLITWLLLKEESRWGGISLRSFYLRRTLRIFSRLLRLLAARGGRLRPARKACGQAPGGGFPVLC